CCSQPIAAPQSWQACDAGAFGSARTLAHTGLAPISSASKFSSSAAALPRTKTSRAGSACSSDDPQLLLRGGFHLFIGVDEVLARRQRLVALEAGRKLRFLVDLPVRRERLVLPLAVARLRRVLGAPTGALFHHAVADQIALEETPVGRFCRVSLR